MSRSKRGKCGCWMCKPWKHGLEPKYKPSERRKLQPEPDDTEAYEDHLLHEDIAMGIADCICGRLSEVTDDML